MLNQHATSLLLWMDKYVYDRKWALKVTIFAVGLSLFFAFPNYFGGIPDPDNETWQAVLLKTQDLGYNVLNQFSVNTNAARVNFRLTVPLVGHLFNLSQFGFLVL